MNDLFAIDPRLRALSDAVEKQCAPQFERAQRVSRENSERVLAAFIHNRVSEPDLHGTTGYGYDDRGRDTLDRVWAEAMGAQAALVRHTLISGTHTIATALFAMLRPGDRMVAVTGRPYDTIQATIGISGTPGQGSLRDYGVLYSEVPLTPDGQPDLPAIASAVRGAKLAHIQRSRGYSLRPSFSVETIGRVIDAIRAADPNVIVFVDNCYGEFVETREPPSVGADLMAGSLIKNAGGGIARTGGYIAGRGDLVELCAYRHTCPGIGAEAGCTLDVLREMYLGLFLAPQTVENAVKTAVFSAALFGALGMGALPAWDAPRTDIVESILTGSAARMVAFCRGIQQGSPVDSFAAPEPGAMPGYASEVIMAAGTFTSGASIELSADGPLRDPYAVWLQGGISYPAARVGVLLAAAEMHKEGLLTLPE